MSVKVVDASAIGLLLFCEPEAPVVSAALEGEDMIAPALITYKVTEICLKKLRMPQPAGGYQVRFSSRG
jgi:uncharacterized protein with PIN domain